jgi:ribosomal protein S18 acetylase RimI-like enzyme
MTTIYQIKSHDVETHVKIYIDIVFNNFIELAKLQYVKHTRQDIYNLLSSEKMFGYIVKYNDKIIAYMFGEISQLSDGRNSYYLTYIYVAQKYRHLKIGSLLLSKIIEHCKHHGIPFIVLTCDTEDEKVMRFYKKFGFILDPILRNNKRHDVLCLYI